MGTTKAAWCRSDDVDDDDDDDYNDDCDCDNGTAHQSRKLVHKLVFLRVKGPCVSINMS